MIPEIGHFSLIVALVLAVFMCVLPILGAARNNMALMATGRSLAVGHFVFIALAFGCLMYAFANDDFSVLYVAQHSNTHLPIEYKISGVWGGHEGSLLLWALMLSGWTLAVAMFSKHLPDEMVARVIGVLGFVAIGFLLFMLLTSSPFERLIPQAVEGRDLNPMLQDPGLIIHPPLLYMGYVGFSVAFAFAISALLGGRMDATWARWSRPWTTIAWVFLTLGIALGSWWAYYELGWGGWWFWDPVENASFLPWLVGTALLHSLAVTEKRGAFKSWTLLLAIAAFSLSLLGTFLVRSGVLTSVHSFASDPQRGLFILGFLVVVVGASLFLFAWRAPKVGLGGRFELMSRETMLLMNNVLLTVACAAVLLGTLYPLIMDALDAGKLSVGPPYFEAIFLPLMVPMIFLMGLGPLARWKKFELPPLARRVRWAFVVAAGFAVTVPYIMSSGNPDHNWTPLSALGFLLAFWLMATIAVGFKERLAGRDSFVKRLKGQSLSYYGMQLAHFGVAVFIIGVTMVNSYDTERDVRMELGSVATLGEYQFRFNGVTNERGPNYQAAKGSVTLMKDGKVIDELHPEKRNYNASGMPMTEAAIKSGITGDIYVSLGEPIPGSDGAWAVRLYVKPFVNWIWAGCFLMAMGGVCAICDRRYRVKAKKSVTLADGSADKTRNVDEAVNPASAEVKA